MRRPRESSAPRGQLAEWVSLHIWASDLVRGLVLFLTAALAFFGMPYNTLLPVFLAGRFYRRVRLRHFGFLVASLRGGLPVASLLVLGVAHAPVFHGMGCVVVVIGWNSVCFRERVFCSLAFTPYPLHGALLFFFLLGFS